MNSLTVHFYKYFRTVKYLLSFIDFCNFVFQVLFLRPYPESVHSERQSTQFIHKLFLLWKIKRKKYILVPFYKGGGHGRAKRTYISILKTASHNIHFSLYYDHQRIWRFQLSVSSQLLPWPTRTQSASTRDFKSHSLGRSQLVTSHLGTSWLYNIYRWKLVPKHILYYTKIQSD